MGGELLRSSAGGDIGDIRCQWEVRVEAPMMLRDSEI